MKQEGYTCDGGCGATLVLDRHGSLMDAGWWHTFPPRGEGTIETCSAQCLVRAVQRREPAMAREIGR